MYKKNAKKMSTNEKLEKFLKEVEAREHKELTNLRASGPREDEYDVLRRSRLYKVATSDRLALHSPGKVSKGSPVRDGIKDFPTRVWEPKTVPILGGVGPECLYHIPSAATEASKIPRLSKAPLEVCGTSGKCVPNYMKSTKSKRLAPPPPAGTSSPDPTRFRPAHKMNPPRETVMWGGQDPSKRRKDHRRRQADVNAKFPAKLQQSRPHTADGTAARKHLVSKIRPTSANGKAKPLSSRKLPIPSTQKYSKSATTLLRNFADPSLVQIAKNQNQKRELLKWYCAKKLTTILRKVDAEKHNFCRNSISDHRAAPIPSGDDTSIADNLIREMLYHVRSENFVVDRDSFLGILQPLRDFSMGESFWCALDRRNVGVISLVSLHALLHICAVTDSADTIETLCSLFRIYCASRPSNTLTLSDLGDFRDLFNTASSTYEEKVKMTNLVEMSFRWKMAAILLLSEKDFRRLLATQHTSITSPRSERSSKIGNDENDSCNRSRESAPPPTLPFEDAEDLPISENHFRAVLFELPDLPQLFGAHLHSRLQLCTYDHSTKK